MLLLVATSVRYNAPVAVLPLVVMLFHWTWAGWRRYVLAIGVWITLTTVGFALNGTLTQREEHEWYSSLALHDLAGTIRFSANYSDAALEHDLAGVPLVVTHDLQKHCRWQYRPTNHWDLWHGERRIFDAPQTEKQRQAIATAWWTVVTGHPRAYLQHRRAVFAAVLTDPFMTVWGRFVENDYQRAMVHNATEPSGLQARWLALECWLSTTFLFHPSFFFALTLAMLPLCRARVGLAILLSGLCYELVLLPIAPSNDFRYSHWMIVCSIIGTHITFASRLRVQAARGVSSTSRLVTVR